ncbi:site-specific integrase [Shewanella sp. 4_MG-2023]|uniref:tyrosine-type recombinase/integrase n=1 Tax=Shewanella sp. 4_MG-2023 TaxID=3062652 RepID=UPI0026E369A6|nr:site-specific integrase [Shewanella sp. 4_MG-2023]MDO6678799.1 site-specific integrase [Shewanella sp. 4_MG-2023]
MVAVNKLSDTFLRKILGKPYIGKSVIADGGSLSVRISKKGFIGWVFRYRLGGRETNPKWVSLGKYPETSIKQARVKRDQCRKWLDNGEDPTVELSLVKVKRKEAVTVKDALEYWLVEYATENRKNVDKHRAQFSRHLYPYLGKYPLEKTTKPQWLECFDRIKKGISNERKGAPVAAGQVLQASKQALLFCRKREYAKSYVIDDLSTTDVGRKQNKRDRVLTEIELQDVINQIKFGNFKEYYSNLFLLLIVFGARTQEIRLSTWTEWDFNKGLWTVPKVNSKTSELIIRPIPKSIYPWLKTLKEKNQKSGYVLGELKRSEAVSAYGSKIWEKLNHETKWTLHDLRRTLATRLSDIGVAPHIVEHLLGHSINGVAGIYNRSQYINEKTVALEKWLSIICILED